MSFVPNLPPQRLFDNEKFLAVVDVENKGTYDVGGPGDRIYISGFDPSIIANIRTSGYSLPFLEGRSQFVPQGALDRASFEGVIRSLRAKNIDRFPVRILATACYGYKTIASETICIDPQPLSATTKQKVCYPTAVSLGTQGAPIAVSDIEVEPSPRRTRFKISVHNVGSGDVFRFGADYLDKCSPFTTPLGFDEVDYVMVEDVIISGTSIRPTCKPLDDGHMRLTNGRGSIFCEFMTFGEDAYTTPITVILSYGYRNTIFKELEILPIY